MQPFKPADLSSVCLNHWVRKDLQRRRQQPWLSRADWCRRPRKPTLTVIFRHLQLSSRWAVWYLTVQISHKSGVLIMTCITTTASRLYQHNEAWALWWPTIQKCWSSRDYHSNYKQCRISTTSKSDKPVLVWSHGPWSLASYSILPSSTQDASQPDSPKTSSSSLLPALLKWQKWGWQVVCHHCYQHLINLTSPIERQDTLIRVRLATAGFVSSKKERKAMKE